MGQELSKVSHIDYFHCTCKCSNRLKAPFHPFSTSLAEPSELEIRILSLCVLRYWGNRQNLGFSLLSQSSRSLTRTFLERVEVKRGTGVRILGRDALRLREQGLVARRESTWVFFVSVLPNDCAPFFSHANEVLSLRVWLQRHVADQALMFPMFPLTRAARGEV